MYTTVCTDLKRILSSYAYIIFCSSKITWCALLHKLASRLNFHVNGIKFIRLLFGDISGLLTKPKYTFNKAVSNLNKIIYYY